MSLMRHTTLEYWYFPNPDTKRLQINILNVSTSCTLSFKGQDMPISKKGTLSGALIRAILAGCKNNGKAKASFVIVQLCSIHKF